MKSSNSNVPIFNIAYDKNGKNTINLREIRYNNKFHNIDHSMNRLQFLRKVTCSINTTTLNDATLASSTVAINPYINNGNNDNEWHLCTLYIEPGRYGSYSDIVDEINRVWSETYNNLFDVSQVVVSGYEGVAFDTTAQQSIIMNSISASSATLSPTYGNDIIMLCKSSNVTYNENGTQYVYNDPYITIPSGSTFDIINGSVIYPAFTNNSFTCVDSNTTYKLSGNISSVGNYITSMSISTGKIDDKTYMNASFGIWEPDSAENEVTIDSSNSYISLNKGVNSIRIVGTYGSDNEQAVYEGIVTTDTGLYLKDKDTDAQEDDSKFVLDEDTLVIESTDYGSLSEYVKDTSTAEYRANAETVQGKEIGAATETCEINSDVVTVGNKTLTLNGTYFEYKVPGVVYEDPCESGSESKVYIVTTDNTIEINNIEYPVIDGKVNINGSIHSVVSEQYTVTDGEIEINNIKYTVSDNKVNINGNIYTKDSSASYFTLDQVTLNYLTNTAIEIDGQYYMVTQYCLVNGEYYAVVNNEYYKDGKWTSASSTVYGVEVDGKIYLVDNNGKVTISYNIYEGDYTIIQKVDDTQVTNGKVTIGDKIYSVTDSSVIGLSGYKVVKYVVIDGKEYAVNSDDDDYFTVTYTVKTVATAIKYPISDSTVTIDCKTYTTTKENNVYTKLTYVYPDSEKYVIIDGTEYDITNDSITKTYQYVGTKITINGETCEIDSLDSLVYVVDKVNKTITRKYNVADVNIEGTWYKSSELTSSEYAVNTANKTVTVTYTVASNEVVIGNTTYTVSGSSLTPEYSGSGTEATVNSGDNPTVTVIYSISTNGVIPIEYDVYNYFNVEGTIYKSTELPSGYTVSTNGKAVTVKYTVTSAKVVIGGVTYTVSNSTLSPTYSGNGTLGTVDTTNVTVAYIPITTNIEGLVYNVADLVNSVITSDGNVETQQGETTDDLVNKFALTTSGIKAHYKIMSDDNNNKYIMIRNTKYQVTITDNEASITNYTGNGVNATYTTSSQNNMITSDVIILEYGLNSYTNIEGNEYVISGSDILNFSGNCSIGTSTVTVYYPVLSRVEVDGNTRYALDVVYTDADHPDNTHSLVLNDNLSPYITPQVDLASDDIAYTYTYYNFEGDQGNHHVVATHANPLWIDNQLSFGSASFVATTETINKTIEVSAVCSQYGNLIPVGTICIPEGSATGNLIDASTLQHYIYDYVGNPIERSAISSNVGNVDYKIKVGNRLVKVAKYLTKTETTQQSLTLSNSDIRCILYGDDNKIYKYSTTEAVYKRIPRYLQSTNSNAKRIKNNFNYKISGAYTGTLYSVLPDAPNTIEKVDRYLFVSKDGGVLDSDSLALYTTNRKTTNHLQITTNGDDNVHYYMVIDKSNSNQVIGIYSFDFSTNGDKNCLVTGQISYTIDESDKVLSGTSNGVSPKCILGKDISSITVDKFVNVTDAENIETNMGKYTSGYVMLLLGTTLTFTSDNNTSIYRSNDVSLAHDYIFFGGMYIDVTITNQYENRYYKAAEDDKAATSYTFTFDSTSFSYPADDDEATVHSLWSTTNTTSYICEGPNDSPMKLPLLYNYYYVKVEATSGVTYVVKEASDVVQSDYPNLLFGTNKIYTTYMFAIKNFTRTADSEVVYIESDAGSDDYYTIVNDSDHVALKAVSNYYTYNEYELVPGMTPYDPLSKNYCLCIESTHVSNDFPDGIYHSRFVGDDMASKEFVEIGDSCMDISTVTLNDNTDIANNMNYVYTVESQLIEYTDDMKFYPITSVKNYIPFDNGPYIKFTKDNKAVYVLEMSIPHMTASTTTTTITEFESGNLVIGEYDTTTVDIYGFASPCGFLDCSGGKDDSNTLYVHSGNNDYTLLQSDQTTSVYTVTAVLKTDSIVSPIKTSKFESYDSPVHSDIVCGPYHHANETSYVVYGFTIRIINNVDTDDITIEVSYRGYSDSTTASLSDLASVQFSNLHFDAKLSKYGNTLATSFDELVYAFEGSAKDTIAAPFGYNERVRKQYIEKYTARGKQMTNFARPEFNSTDRSYEDLYLDALKNIDYEKQTTSVNYSASVGTFINTDPADMIRSKDASFYIIKPNYDFASIVDPTILASLSSANMEAKYYITSGNKCTINVSKNTITFPSRIELTDISILESTINVDRSYLHIVSADSYSGEISKTDGGSLIRDNVSEISSVDKLTQSNIELKYDNYFNLSSSSFVTVNDCGKNKIELVFNSSIIPVVPSSPINYYTPMIEELHDDDNTTELMPKIISLENGEFKVNDSMMSVYNNKFSMINNSYHNYNDNPRATLWGILGIEPCRYDYSGVVKSGKQPIHIIAGRYYTEDLYVGDAYPMRTVRIPSTRKVLSSTEGILGSIEYFNKTNHKAKNEINIKVPRMLKLYAYPNDKVAEISLNQINTNTTRAIAEYKLPENIIEGTNGTMPIGVQINLDVNQNISLLLTSDEQRYLLVPNQDTELYYSRT